MHILYDEKKEKNMNCRLQLYINLLINVNNCSKTTIQHFVTKKTFFYLCFLNSFRTVHIV